MKNKQLAKERIKDIENFIRSINDLLLEDFSFGTLDDIDCMRIESKEFNYQEEKTDFGEIMYQINPVAGMFSKIISIDQNKETFSQHLSKIMEEKKISSSEIYNRIFMDRRLLSKIKNNKEYIPRKYNVMALAIALRLDIEESEIFLRKAGYSFSDWEKFDLIIKFYIENKVYDIFEINLALEHFHERTIGA